MFNNLRDTVRCLPAQHKHPERCRVHNNTSTNSTNKPICMLILVGRKLWFHSWINDLLPIWSVKFLLYTQGVVFISLHLLIGFHLFLELFPQSLSKRVMLGKREEPKDGESRGERARWRRRGFFFQTLCYWNEKEMFLMWENPLTSVQAVRWHRQLKSLTLCLFGYLSVTS